ncbi:MAG TPA: glycosyltransferase family 4 protein [Ornithinimicrobium sp.]|uniref:glycosyltransferase family 4 protein n=1 Tax=Ornithinimicrobium sp. TaxID=1977084 RepID=UPI002B474CDC|nr:glycosyltransferase family 4 protein [Ornithinimicrobium sp.]HKJ11998.1 glycosyltransferase family 4 protein [Ornithinimicrobium sp.]
MSEARPRLISPGGLPGPSGGTRYNERVAAEWGIEVEYLPGGWPHPSTEDLANLDALLHTRGGARPVLLDGLIASAAGATLGESRPVRGRPERPRVVVLLHLPLPAETGLSPAQQAQLGAREGAALAAADAVACTSDWAAADLHRRYRLTGAVVAEPGADLAPVAAGSHPPRWLTLGAFSPRKNHDLLLEAFQHPCLQSQSWQALWVGPEAVPGARARLSRAVVSTARQDRVEVAAALTGEDLEDVWAGTDLLLLPSWVESYGMVVTEALAHGIPAVVGAGTAAEHTLRGTGARLPGAVVDPGDPHAWAAVLHSWLMDETLRRRWRRSALERRADLPTWSATAQRLRDLLDARTRA